MTAGQSPAAAPPPSGHFEMTKGSSASLAPIAMVAVVVVALVLGAVAFLTTQKSSTDADDEAAVTSATTSTPSATAAPATTTITTTSISTTTTATTTTTTTTTTTVPPDPQVVAQSELRAFIDADRSRLESLVGTWLPQVSAKQQGEVWPGPYVGIEEAFPYQLSDIVEEHRVLDDRFGVLMANGSEFNFRFGGRDSSDMMDGWYISLVDRPFPDAGGALDWCRENSIDRDNCAAKFLTNDQNAGVTLVLQ